MFKKQHIAAVFTAIAAMNSNAVPFQNGSFEIGPVASPFVALSQGDTSITGWTVAGGDIDYIGTYWPASDGTYSLDLNNTFLSPSVAGGISQTFDTISGAAYQVMFDMAGNPEGLPTIKTMDVAVNDVVNVTSLYSNSYTFDTTGKSAASMGWTTHSFNFVAGSASTEISFLSADPNTYYGAALDNVTVSIVPEPAAAAVLVIAGGALVLSRSRRPNTEGGNRK